MSLVRKDIETYAAWPTNSSNPDLAVQGIFFDETPQQYDANALAYLKDLTTLVKNTTGLGPDNFVSLVLPYQYFSASDYPVDHRSFLLCLTCYNLKLMILSGCS